jgi:hypothetical protein
VIDYVSSSNGCASCGPSSLSFKDKLAGLVISTWPYRGYNLNANTFKLTLDPALADANSVITVTTSLDNYQTVTMSQDITAVVNGGKTAPKSLNCLPNQILNVMINELAFLELPPLQAQSSYNVTS